MTTPWIRAQDRKRNLVAAASTACIYAFAFAVAWAIGLLAPSDLATSPGLVLVDLGGTEGNVGDIPLGLPNAPDRPPDAQAGAAPLPAKGAETPLPPAKEEPAAKNAIPEPATPSPAKVLTSKPATPAKTTPKATPKTATTTPKTAPAKTAKTIPENEAPEPEPAAAPGPTAEELAAQQAYEQALAAAKATAAARSTSSSSTKKFGSSGSPVDSATGTGTGPGVAGGTGTATYRGLEMGNAYTTVFGASTGLVGQNLYVPIYLYMPLPGKVDDSIYQRIQTKGTFRSIYDQSGSIWVLKAQLPLQERADYWRMLEEAGYDPAKADFKAGKKLKTAELEFAVAPVKGALNAKLVDVRIVTSSGSTEIDDAVLYGFKQTAFFNKTGNAVSGKFSYSF